MAYQVVPPSQVVSTKMSTLVDVDVSVGAVPPLHLIAAGQVIALAVPSAVKAKVKPYAVPDAGMLLKVIEVIAALSDTWNTFPSAQFKANTPLEIVGAVFTSFNPVIVGVVSAGEVEKTRLPAVPVSLVKAVARLAELGVARNSATLVPSPLTPVDIGRPVHEVSVPEVGVPRMGVTSVGLVASAFAPEPVEVVTPVPPDKTASVAESPAAVPEVFWLSVGKVQFAKFPDVGVPSIGVTKVGDVKESVSPLCSS